MAASVIHAIIGTAGHIDHGKTALVKALTGQDTDRLQEEKDRGISIELGFAWMTLPDGRRAGVVDVPGHERFIRNMLAGAHGIDLVLFTIAADDGVMPQSEEHLDIIHLLGTARGIFVITKADLADSRRLDEVREEITILADGTALESAPILAVSALDGTGLDQLRDAVASQLQGFDRRRPAGLFRLPLDRVFTIKGHGIVVTGTAIGAEVAVGQRLRLLPGGDEVRVRSLQVHNEPVERAGLGQRVAINLSGAERIEVQRGMVLCDERLDQATARFDARLEIRPAAKRPLTNHQHVRLFLGTAETQARVIVLEGGEIAPKHRALAQLVLDEPIAALKGDRFVIRDETNVRTLGGGVVLNPFGRASRRPLEAYIAHLETVAGPFGSAAIEAMINLQESFVVPLSRIALLLNTPDAEVRTALRDSRFVGFGTAEEAGFTTAARWQALKSRVVKILTEFHRENPLIPGMEMEELRSHLPQAITLRDFRMMVERMSGEAGLVREESRLRLNSHRVRLTPAQDDLSVRLERILNQAGCQPPELKQLAEQLQMPLSEQARLRTLLAAMERESRVARVAADLYFSRDALAIAKAKLIERLRLDGKITAATYRDVLGASRKFAIALLDYFDHTGVTLRTGDERKLREPL
ncbi:MAG TPA: selenocysteine-specific translation elongation factor [Candidatus Binataceae bacterium]|nr:selenocysteine-specific translation elongation factor [Candidatus Binataceae bacterium]